VSTTLRQTDQQNPTPPYLVLDSGELERAVRGRRFDPVLIGFWLGGILLGAAGCLLGARMPYHHPVAVTLSVVWWGVFCGCSGAVAGALLGMWAERTPPPAPGHADEER
jgi:hypothetical protein